MIVRRAAWVAEVALALLLSPPKGVPRPPCFPPAQNDPPVRLRLTADTLVGIGVPPRVTVTLTNVGMSPITFTRLLDDCVDLQLQVTVKNESGDAFYGCLVHGGRIFPTPTATVSLKPGEFFAEDARFWTYNFPPEPAYYSAVAHWRLYLDDNRCIDETSNVLGFRIARATTDHPSY